MPPLTYPPMSPDTLPDHARALVARAAEFAAGASAPATRRAYASDWMDWERWCAVMNVSPLPASPVVLGAYLADRAACLSVATIVRRLSAIATAHRQAGHHLDVRHPAVKDVMKGIRRTRGTAARQARPATTVMVQRMAATCDASLLGLRDRALLLLGFASALRRSELVALEETDLEFADHGVKLLVRRSKGDQEASGQVVGVLATGTATCPVSALRAWLDAAGIVSGRVFRSIDRHGHVRSSMTGEAVALIVQRRAALAGLDPAGLTAHSLRAGLATAAAAAGVAEADIQRQTRHRSVTVLRTYVRHGSVFIRNPSGAVGL